MVRFINEIILKYLLGISKCTKLPGKKHKKTKEKKNINRNNISEQIQVYILDIFTYWK